MTEVTADVEKWIGQYVALRDTRKKLKEEWEAKDAELRTMMDDRGGRLQHFLDEHKVDKAATKAGTVYCTTRYSASLADPDAFMKFIIANQKFDLLDRKANTTAVREYVEKEKTLPPGCNLSAMTTVGVRRPSISSDHSKE